MLEVRDKLEQLRFLSQTHRAIHDQTRRVRQRVLLSVSALYVLAATAALKGDVSQRMAAVPKRGIWFAFLVFGAVASAYLFSTHRSDRLNMRIAEAAEDEVAKLTEVQELIGLIGDSSRRPWCYWGWVWQTIAIIAVGTTSALPITSVY